MGKPSVIENVRSMKPAIASGIPHKSNFKNVASGKSILAIWIGIASVDSITTTAVGNLSDFEGVLGTGIVNYNTTFLNSLLYLRVFLLMLF